MEAGATKVAAWDDEAKEGQKEVNRVIDNTMEIHELTNEQLREVEEAVYAHETEIYDFVFAEIERRGWREVYASSNDGRFVAIGNRMYLL